MAELRRNIVSGKWVAVAPLRGQRPIDTKPGNGPENPPSHSKDCPFCPGNESALAEILWELADDRAPGWKVRAVPNLFPAFTPDPGWKAGDGSPSHRAATGDQEVLIESPRHDGDPSRYSSVELRAMVKGFRERYSHLLHARGARRVFLFRNRGHDAGVSLAHPHSQLVALSFVPPLLRRRERRLVRYRKEKGVCLLCVLENAEPEGARRVVLRNDSFTALVPWAAEASFEVWIVPRRHDSDFARMDAREEDDLSKILGELLKRYRERAGNPPYNLILHSGGRRRSGLDAIHWYVRLLPRTTLRAGFEVASGITIVPSLPEEDAEVLSL